MDPEFTKIVLGCLASLQAITIAIVGMLFKQGDNIKKSTEATKEQIVNHHPEQPNFREENDLRHRETKRWFMQLSTKVATIQGDMDAGFRNLHERWDELTTWALENRQRIESIETTANTKESANE